ncbi:hypothetical protein GMRT_15332 [Giardia muris]|uniref:Uncharacterized protein n=1 Tax=Giardia muris TaxID=5742 RepID=A0A4Z1T4J3_GIAMU|nr:hypothetical protein GMRT_15332 [Giardia muris]|eukprot:TNJ28913.1 hypothetical protein GMRT_15332 [Giardia muris]
MQRLEDYVRVLQNEEFAYERVDLLAHELADLRAAYPGTKIGTRRLNHSYLTVTIPLNLTYDNTPVVIHVLLTLPYGYPNTQQPTAKLVGPIPPEAELIETSVFNQQRRFTLEISMQITLLQKICILTKEIQAHPIMRLGSVRSPRPTGGLGSTSSQSSSQLSMLALETLLIDNAMIQKKFTDLREKMADMHEVLTKRTNWTLTKENLDPVILATKATTAEHTALARAHAFERAANTLIDQLRSKELVVRMTSDDFQLVAERLRELSLCQVSELAKLCE